MLKAILATVSTALLLSGSVIAQTSEDDNGSDAKMPTGLHMNEDTRVQKMRKLEVWGVSPIHFSEDGVGFALSYEHGIDEGGIVTYVLPVAATFDMTNTSYTNSMFYFMPGLKFYPTSNKGKVKYAVGPSLVVGGGIVHDYYYYNYYNPTGYYTPYQDQSKFLLGVMVNNSINFLPAPHLYLGLEFGFGFSYINQIDGRNNGVSGVVQGGFKIGYRK